MIRGVQKFMHRGALVFRVHYSSIHDPTTEAGARWVAEESEKYPGGIHGTAWRREQEIDWSVRGRRLVFPTWATRIRQAIVLPDRKIVVQPNWTVGVGYDYGVSAPFCALFVCRASPLEVYVKSEIYERGVPAPKQAEMMQEHPLWSRTMGRVWGDPSIWREDQTVVEMGVGERPQSAMTSVGKMLRSYGVTVRPGNNDPGADIVLRDLLTGVYWQDLSHPMLYISDACTNLIWEMEHLSIKDHISRRAREEKPPLEKIVSRRNHGWDALKYEMLAHPKPVRQDPRRRADPMTVQGVRQEMRARRERLRRILYA